MARRRGQGRNRGRGGRQRSRLVHASGPPMNPEHRDWILSSARQERTKQQDYRRFKDDGSPGQRQFEEAAKEAADVFVGNVPHGTTAAELVKYLHGQLSLPSPPPPTAAAAAAAAPILRCEVKKKGRSTFAFVSVRSREIAEALQNRVTRLILGGRTLTVKPPKAAFRKRPMGTAPGFKCGGLQLCAEWPTGELTCLYAVKSGVTFQVSRTSSLASLMFKDDSGMDGRAEFKRRHVDGEVELAKSAGRAWLVFRLIRPPFLFGHEQRKDAASSALGGMFGTVLLDEIMAITEAFRGGSVWELDDGEGERNGAKLPRVGDLSPNGAFGRCLVYRVDVSRLLEDKSESARLYRELHAFRLCNGSRPREDRLRFPLRVHFHSPGQPQDGYSQLRKYHALPYRVKFLITCLTSNLKFDALALCEEAVSLLAGVGEESACLALSAMLGTDPRAHLEGPPSEEILRWLEGGGPSSGITAVIGSGSVMIPRASVTPLRVVCQPPEQEMSNGVTRQYARHSDRFLRVNFVDENMGRLPMPLSDSLVRRLEVILNEGLEIAGRMYEFLAYSSSQLRGHSCFFYASGGGGGDVPTAESIRRWMGDMSGINVVGKHAARLGQSLSSTTSTVEVRPEWKKLVPDKAVGPYEFTDGCGMMSQDLARQVADRLGHSPNGPPPSAFQIRMGGCKGMLAVWPDSVMKSVSGSAGYKVLVRPSMEKFPSNRNSLEVVQYARRLPCFLNRQFITLLSTLGVSDGAIETLYEAMLETLDKMTYDRFEAEGALVRYYNTTSGPKTGRKQVGPLWEALAMLRAGFGVTSEPWLQSMLRATRGKALIDLRHRTRIFVPKASCLLGVVDETGSVKPGEVYFSSSEVPAGTPVLVCRNPSLHPGDLRVLKTAGNLPQLGHLVNVLVFASEGDRPEPSKMSGGDLDGDLYAVVWDPDLLLPKRRWVAGQGGDEDSENGWNFPAMGYEPPEKPRTTAASSSTGGVEIGEITDFFVNYIRNDNLGMIANSHLVWADESVDGARCAPCLQLAALHSKAVDFPKSGVHADYPLELRPEMYPDFMCKKDRLSYKSTKLIGRLFRKTPEAGFTNPNPQESQGIFGGFEVDPSLLVLGWEEFLPEAEAVFGEYTIDVMALANKYGVTDEGQLVSGQVERFGGRMLKRTKLEDAQGRLNTEFAQIKAKYRAKFQGQSHDEEEDDEEEEEDDDNGDDDAGCDVKGNPGMGKEATSDDVNYGQGSSADDPMLKNAPDGMEAYQKASAWYHVAYSDATNPFIAEARGLSQGTRISGARRGGRSGRDGVGRGFDEPPHMLYLSFPWICAYEQLCQIKETDLKHGSS